MIDNKKIPTWLGVVIIIIFAITAGMFVRQVVKNQEARERQGNMIGMRKQEASPVVNQKKNQDNQDISKEEEFPSVSVEPGMSIEDIIKQALYKRTPDWKIKNYSIAVTVETNRENHAIGRFTYDGYNVVKDGTYHNTGDGIWFAAQSDNSWTLAVVSGVGYNGSCQIFKKYKFPSDMTPDCWDTEKNALIDTSNPQRFYANGFAKKDKKELVQAFIDYAKRGATDGSGYWSDWLTKTLYVKVNKHIRNYLSGTILIGGSENISPARFFATKQSGKWIVVYNGQDKPLCSAVDPYNFPKEIVDGCR